MNLAEPAEFRRLDGKFSLPGKCVFLNNHCKGDSHGESKR
jgi:hypothetical protein